MSDMSLILEFVDGSRSFVHGFEAGCVWEMIKAGEPFEQEVHAANTELYIRMAESLGAEVTAEMLDDTWSILRFEVAA